MGVRGCLFFFILFLFNFKSFAGQSYDLRLEHTRVLNMPEILQGLGLLEPGDHIVMQNPYRPYSHIPESPGIARSQILQWFNTYKKDERVCGVYFVDTKKQDYLLKTFNNEKEAIAFGYKVTHLKECGACSTLKDLALYLKSPDLTTPVRTCTRKIIFKKMVECLTNDVGFTPQCAMAWAYNAQTTRKFCKSVCLKDYGLTNILLNHFSDFPDNLPDGTLRPCIKCDEEISGPGFKYSAGRTRRNSGIISGIQRSSEEIAHINHSNYFQ